MIHCHILLRYLWRSVRVFPTKNSSSPLSVQSFINISTKNIASFNYFVSLKFYFCFASLGWKKIDDFVTDFFKKHPDPEPVPELLDSISVRLFGNGAWVTYEQLDSLRGRKRETRLMEKVDGQWKIAGMQTTIYGFDD